MLNYQRVPFPTFPPDPAGSERHAPAARIQAPRPGADGAHRRAADFAARGPPLFLGRQQGSKHKENGKKSWENQENMSVCVENLMGIFGGRQVG